MKSFAFIGLLSAVIIGLTLHNCTAKVVKQDVNDEFKSIMHDNNKDFRFECLADLDVLITSVIHSMNDSIEAMAETNPDQLKINLGKLIKTFDGIKQGAASFKPRTETGKMSKEYFETIFGFFDKYFKGIISRLDGAQNEKGLKSEEFFLEFIKQKYVGGLKQIDKMLKDGKKDLTLQALKDSLELNMLMLSGLSRVQPLEPLEAQTFLMMKDFFIKPIAYLALKINSLN